MLGLWEYFWTEADWVPPAAPTSSWMSVLIRNSIRGAGQILPLLFILALVATVTG